MEPKLNVREQVPLDSHVDEPIHHFNDDPQKTNVDLIGQVGFARCIVHSTYLDNFPHCQVDGSF